jgi:hypothetical protein
LAIFAEFRLNFAAVKLFGYILAFLVLALSCFPCADAKAEDLGTIKTEISQSSQSTEDHEDACSPFCQCACCAGFSIDHTVALSSSGLNYSGLTYSSFLPSDIIEISLPIWQPPQLV